MVKNVLIVDKKDFEEKKKEIIKGGADKLHVISDFDRTITYGLTGEGKRTATVISQLRSDPKYLGEDYQKEAHKLFDIYHPIEIDSKISLEEKQKKMYEWWKKHFDLISKSGLTKSLIKKVVKEKPLNFRKGSLELMSFLNSKKIPVVFMSASLGDMLLEYLKQNKLIYPNVFVVGNQYKFDKEGKVIKVIEPIIHTFNKTEVSLRDTEIYDKIENRKNVILMGDSLGDVGMVEGFDYDNLIKIGFLNENVEGDLEEYKKVYDVVILNDGDMSFVNEMLEGLK